MAYIYILFFMFPISPNTELFRYKHMFNLTLHLNSVVCSILNMRPLNKLNTISDHIKLFSLTQLRVLEGWGKKDNRNF